VSPTRLLCLAGNDQFRTACRIFRVSLRVPTALPSRRGLSDSRLYPWRASVLEVAISVT
jgi:hypothetical protein